MSLDASDRETQSTAKIAPPITAVHNMRIIAGATDPIECPGSRSFPFRNGAGVVY